MGSNNLQEPSLSGLVKLLRDMDFAKAKLTTLCSKKHTKEGKVVILIVYVGDIIIMRDDHVEILKLKEKLAADFEIEGLGPLKYFLIMEFAKSKEEIFVNQRKYVLDLLKEIGMLGCKAANTPIEPNMKLKLVMKKR